MDTHQQALAMLATEWFKAARRALKLAIEAAPHRYERERAQLSYSHGRIQETLTLHGLRVHEFDGQPYSPSLPAEALNPEDFENEEGLVVAETVEPTVLLEGRILMRGKVVLKRAGQ
jgi:hypothetical protein